MPQLKATALPRHREGEETDNTRTNVRKALRLALIKVDYNRKFIKISFLNKRIEFIILPTIFNDRHIITSI